MNTRSRILFFLPAWALFVLFILIPSTLTWVDALFIHRGSEKEFAGLLYFKYALGDVRFHQSLSNNIQYFLWTLLFEVAAGLCLALGLEKSNALNRWLRIAFFSPAVLSMVVIGLVFGFLLRDGIGFLPRFMGGGFSFLDESHAVLTISVVSGWAYCGLYMIIFLAGLAATPREVLEAASLDGANAWQMFWHVKWPLLQPVFFVVLLICFTGAFKAFDLFWVMLPNQDHSSILATLLVREYVQFDNKGYGSALAVLLTVFVVAATLLFVGLHGWYRRAFKESIKP